MIYIGLFMVALGGFILGCLLANWIHKLRTSLQDNDDIEG
jgi:hypothetical protein